MEGLDTLTRLLARRTPEQLAALLTRHAEPLARRPAPTELRGPGKPPCGPTKPSTTWCCTSTTPGSGYSPPPARLSQERTGRTAPAPGADYQSLMAHRLSFAHLAGEPVPPQDVFAALGADRPDRHAPPPRAALRALYDDGLGRPHRRRAPSSSPPRLPNSSRDDLGPFRPDAPRLTPDPSATPAWPAAPVPATSPYDESRAAAAAFAATLERLLASLATQPAALRKSAGWPYGRSNGWPRPPAPPNRTSACSSTSPWPPS
ncbi:hypothetical protein [Streptomyces endophytica]|uniref:Uncharacterized protein n=1 Tax=Streptomyces endophytica TaxID=2991496 RepID=A0ABY6PDF4_9ACTN|nr:hypothetical protein [Streptomyces endophytica]UZJ31860.1 hypothetical protein OJ254_18235 [Streptomyces endophytica]